METQTFDLAWLHSQQPQNQQRHRKSEKMKMDGNYLVLNNDEDATSNTSHPNTTTTTTTFVINDDEDDDDGDVLIEETSNGMQIAAAQNLIQLANDASVLNHIINNGDDDGGGHTVFVTADGTEVDCSSIIRVDKLVDVINGNTIAYAAEGGVYEDVDEAITEEVTEEVITDDWVQHQGEERVEISADQVIGTTTESTLETAVPLSSVQDEYSARRPYPCDFCSRRFRKESSLNLHMVAHQSNRPNLCKLCGSRFFHHSDLIAHLKNHPAVPDIDNGIAEVNNFNYIPSSSRHQYLQTSQETSINDHFYETDFNSFSNNQKLLLQHNNVKQIKMKSKLKNDSSNAPSFATNDLVAPPPPPPRGRISRLKPKIAVSENAIDTSNSLDFYDNRQYELDLHNSPSIADEHKEEADVAGNLLPSPADQLKYPILCDSKPFVCQQCGLAFGRQKAYQSHLKSHRNDSVFECEQCNETFWNEQNLEEHRKLAHTFDDSNSEYAPEEAEDTQSESETDKQQLYGEFYCGDCGMAFHRKDLLTRHSKTHALSMQSNNLNSAFDSNKDQQHCCNTCGETFAEALDLLAHAEIHARYAPFKCVLCGESFFEEHTIKKHLQSLHANKLTENSCILCGKQCKDRKALMKHAWDHSREKSHSCSKCGKNFHNKARLKRHMASHRDKTVKCEVCLEEFPDGRSLSNHRHSHSTTSSGKLFPCHECGKTFGSRSSQQIHVRIHTGEKPYGCRFCWKAFADGGTLRKHERIHTGEKPYACSVCPRAFNQRVVLREHIRSHHSGLDPKRNAYFCMVCDQELGTSNDLISHLIEHSDMKTAMQRQPITGPRKYKRRRKLKPHEIERLRNEQKSNISNSNPNSQQNSDAEISDLDMEKVDELLDVNESEVRNKPAKTRVGAMTATTTATTTTDKRKQAKNSKINRTQETKRRSKNRNDENFVENTTTIHSKMYEQSFLNYDELDKKLDNSRKSNADNYKLLTNIEDALENIDTLVVDNSSNSNSNSNNNNSNSNCDRNELNSFQSTTKIGMISRNNDDMIVDDNDDDKIAQRTQQVQIRRNKVDATLNNSCMSGSGSGSGSDIGKATTIRSDKISQNSPTQRYARMIHTTEKNNGRDYVATPVSRRRKRNDSNAINSMNSLDHVGSVVPHSSISIVDDYEIISPATQPPNQISSSPVHLKAEQDNNLRQQRLNQQQQQISNDYQESVLLYKNQMQQQHRRRRHLTSQSSQTSRSSDLYDAQLLLEASSFRKDSFSDLDDIFRSPLKGDNSSLRNSNRNRLNSDCSPQYIAEHCVDEAHLIKIEPTSPDLHEIFNTACSSSSNLTNTRHNSSGEQQPQQSNQKQHYSMRSHRAITKNRRYLDFMDNNEYQQQQQQHQPHSTAAAAIHQIATPTTSSDGRNQAKRNRENSNNTTTVKGRNFASYSTSSPCSSKNRKISKSKSKSSPSSVSSNMNLEISAVRSNGKLVNKSDVVTIRSSSNSSITTSPNNNHNHNNNVNEMHLSMNRNHRRDHLHHHHLEQHDTSLEMNSSFDSFSSLVNVTTSAAATPSISSSATAIIGNDALSMNNSNNNNKVAEKKRTYFECEMCSAKFTDRAQLLDHVPIHI